MKSGDRVRRDRDVRQKPNADGAMEMERSVEIDRPIEEVFDCTINHVAEWSITVVEEESLKRTPEVVGTTFRVVTEDRGRRMEFQGVATAHEPPTAHSVHMTGRRFDIDADYFFDDLSGRTRVTERATVKGKGFLTIILFLLGWLMRGSSCRALDAELANLKCLLESREEQASD
jgi:hypothetical protein